MFTFKISSKCLIYKYKYIFTVNSQWNIEKCQYEYNKEQRISDTHFVHNGIIITKWQNEYKKWLQIPDTQFVRNEIIITKWRNKYKKGVRISPNLFAMK